MIASMKLYRQTQRQSQPHERPALAWRSIGMIVLSLGTMIWSSCNLTNTITRPQDVIFPTSKVSYSGQVEPFLRLGCAFEGCHSQNSTIPLDSYFNLYHTPGLVIAGKPESSTLTQVINGKLSHNYSLTSIVTENHRSGMSTWVREGALNN